MISDDDESADDTDERHVVVTAPESALPEILTVIERHESGSLEIATETDPNEPATDAPSRNK